MEQVQQAPAERVWSIDVFRGLTILVMIFVNDLSSVRNIPAWLKHMPGQLSGMTFVDVVFPAFLFIVGLAIPFSIDKRLAAGTAEFTLWMHIALRSLGLMVIGVFMVNQESLADHGMAIAPAWWILLLYGCVILVWNSYAKVHDWRKAAFSGLRISGWVGLALLFWAYRSADGSAFAASWWGILGLIGWAYWPACLAYRLFRRNPAAIAGLIALFTAFNIGHRLWTADFQAVGISWRWGLNIGAHGSITLAGVLVGIILSATGPVREQGRRIRWILGSAAFFWLGGLCLTPLFGINKNMASPAWCLYSSAYCCIIFAFLYWLIDGRGVRRWALFLRPAGENPLLAYILPEIVMALLALLHITALDRYLGSGVPGVCRALCVSLALVYFTGLLGRLGVRLKF